MRDEDFVKRVVDKIAESLDSKVIETVYQQTKSKDEELSGLHREILTKIDEVQSDVLLLKGTVESHHEFIEILKDIFKTGGYIRKFFLWILVFVPGIAGFLAGCTFIYKYFNEN